MDKSPPASPGRTLRFLAAALALAVISLSGPAAETAPVSYLTKSWRVDDGLPHNATTRIVQDPRGFLWIATGGGLARFDGREFKVYPVPNASPEASLNIRDMVLREDGSLVMVPASGGVICFHDGVFTPHPSSAAFENRQLLFVYLEPGGAVWVVSGQELLRCHEGKIETFGPPDGLNRRGHRPSIVADRQGQVWVAVGDFFGRYEKGRLVRWPDPFGSPVTLAPARNGGVWVATSTRLWRMQQGKLETVSSGPEWSEDREALQELFEDRKGILWIGSRRHGLSRLEGGHVYRTPTSHEQIAAITEDSEDNLWVASSGGGIERLKPQTFELHDATTGLPDDMSTSVCSDASGALWVANRRGGLVRIVDGKSTVIRGPAVTPSFYASVVCPDREGAIWVGAVHALFRMGTAPGSELERVSSDLSDAHVIFCSSTGDVWIASEEGRLGYFRGGVYRDLGEKEGYNHRRIYAITEDRRGAVLCVASDRRVYTWNGSRLEDKLPGGSIPGGLLYAAHSDARGLLWFATSAGLVLWRDGKFHLFGTRQGLPDDLLSQILEDERGRLWCGSRRGVFSVAVADLLAVADGRENRVNALTLGVEEGMRGASTLNGFQPAAWKGRDGRLWFTTYEGVFGIDPDASQPPSRPPRVYIDEVLVDQQPVKVEKTLRLRPEDRQVEFRFTALNFAAPEKVMLRHRLDGYDFGWVESNQRMASYARLPPGAYTLRVSAATQGGPWSETGEAVALTVLPAWWQTWWLRAGLVIAFAALVGGFVRFWSHRRLRTRLVRLEHEHALEKERARIARDLHDDLGGSLTQIGLLADRLKRQAAEASLKPALAQLAWRTRQLAGDLESIVWTVSPKNNTLDRLAVFVAQYARGFFRDTSVECVVDGEETVPAVPVAPEAQHHLLAVLKEALNNVLKHARATTVKVTMAVTDGHFVLRIADNGAGFDPAAAEHSERNGLTNMKARVADLGGTLGIASGQARGTELVLRQPLAGIAPAPTAETRQP
ncbi:MAG TPA: two-component regulator propeller domain-containing protein [Opitutaceae bacterium]|nr:two-component regulator propeller domain-containing protein [Opitutaceae bacterium]